MARMHPPVFLDVNNSSGERRVYNLLRALPPDVSVIHSLRLKDPSAPRRASSEFEADFVVLDPREGLLVIEVKGGDIRCEAGQWMQRNRATGVENAIDPMRQADDVMHVIRRDIAANLDDGDRLLTCAAIWFPDAVIDRRGLPPDCPSELVFDASDIANCEAVLARAFAYGRNGREWKLNDPGELVERALHRLRPTLVGSRPLAIDEDVSKAAPVGSQGPTAPLEASWAAASDGRWRRRIARFGLDLALSVAKLPIAFAALVGMVIGSILFWIMGLTWKGTKALANLALTGGILTAIAAVLIYVVGPQEDAEPWPRWGTYALVLAFAAFTLLAAGERAEAILRRSRTFARLRSVVTLGQPHRSGWREGG